MGADEPLLQAWQKVFPNTIKPYAEMSADLMDHVRYPEDLFKVQRELLGQYHVTDPDSFYDSNDAWAVPTTPPGPDSAVKQPPYYLSLKMPSQEAETFSLTSTFIPQTATGGQQRNVLFGFLSAEADAGSGKDGVKADGYGTLRLLELPRSTVVPGPGQAQQNFDSNTEVSTQLNLLRQGASTVKNGNLLSLPVGGGILYVQPVYVQSTGQTAYPTLRKVLVSFGDEVGFAGHALRGPGPALQGILRSGHQRGPEREAQHRRRHGGPRNRPAAALAGARCGQRGHPGRPGRPRRGQLRQVRRRAAEAAEGRRGCAGRRGGDRRGQREVGPETPISGFAPRHERIDLTPRGGAVR